MNSNWRNRPTTIDEVPRTINWINYFRITRKKEDKVLLNKIKHLIDYGNNMNPSSTFSKIKGVYFNPKWCHTADDKA